MLVRQTPGSCNLEGHPLDANRTALRHRRDRSKAAPAGKHYGAIAQPSCVPAREAAQSDWSVPSDRCSVGMGAEIAAEGITDLASFLFCEAYLASRSG